ncbi:MAG: energy transducer TonB [Salibacteraceae bacterium]
MKPQKNHTTERLLIGCCIGLAITLCGFEYANPIAEREAYFSGWEDPFDDFETLPAVKVKLPKPKMKQRKPDLSQTLPATVPQTIESAHPTDTATPNHSDTFLTSIVIPETVKAEPKFVLIPERWPEFPGGEAALFEFLNEHLHYPQPAIKNGIEGVVYVEFVVSSDGTIDPSTILVLRGVHPWLDREAVLAIKRMPKWKPGMQRGVPVLVPLKIPIRFALRN